MKKWELKEWEYEVIEASEKDLKERINELGGVGWEVVNFIVLPPFSVFKVLLKREKKEDYPPSGMAGAL